MSGRNFVKEIRDHFHAGDVEVCMRKLQRLVYDTEDMALYAQAIDLSYLQLKKDFGAAFEEKFKTLLGALDQIDFTARHEGEVLLEAKQVVKTYPNNTFSLHLDELQLQTRKVLGLVGENGNGKTTLLTILAQERSSDTDAIRYYLKPTPRSLYELRTRLAYIPQRSQRWYGSLKNNLRFLLSSYGVDKDEIELRMMLMIASWGLLAYQDLKWEELSSGYKMRFELARTMLRKPQVLLLDEPLANLDIVSQQVMLEDIKYMANLPFHPMAVILSSQQLYEVEHVADEVLFLKGGKLINQNNLGGNLLVIELASSEVKERVESTFAPLTPTKVSYNAGTFLCEFPEGVVLKDVWKILANADLQVTMLRDISNSSRRFF